MLRTDAELTNRSAATARELMDAISGSLRNTMSSCVGLPKRLSQTRHSVIHRTARTCNTGRGRSKIDRSAALFRGDLLRPTKQDARHDGNRSHREMRSRIRALDFGDGRWMPYAERAQRG